MKRRLRKKLHLGEFDHQGFEISCRFEPPLDDAAGDAIMNEFIRFAESYDFAIGGGVSSSSMLFFVTRVRRTSRRCPKSFDGFWWVDETCMISDLALVEAWWSMFEKVVDLKVGPLQSCWHGGAN